MVVVKAFRNYLGSRGKQIVFGVTMGAVLAAGISGVWYGRGLSAGLRTSSHLDSVHFVAFQAPAAMNSYYVMIVGTMNQIERRQWSEWTERYTQSVHPKAAVNVLMVPTDVVAFADVQPFLLIFASLFLLWRYGRKTTQAAMNAALWPRRKMQQLAQSRKTRREEQVVHAQMTESREELEQKIVELEKAQQIKVEVLTQQLRDAQENVRLAVNECQEVQLTAENFRLKWEMARSENEGLSYLWNNALKKLTAVTLLHQDLVKAPRAPAAALEAAAPKPVPAPAREDGSDGILNALYEELNAYRQGSPRNINKMEIES